MKKLPAIVLTVTLLFMALGSGIVSADDPSDPLQADASSDPDVTTVEATVNNAGSIEEVDPATIPCDSVADLEDVLGGGDAGINYDGILVSGGLQFAERFTGQTLSFSGNFDVLTGSPSGPLALQTGDPNENVGVLLSGSQIVVGQGPLGHPDWDAVGEGSVAVLFPTFQSQFKLDIVGAGGGGSATLNFFKADGSLLGTVVISPPANQTYGFRHSGGIREIAGFSIHNSDPGGKGNDNKCYDDTIIEPPVIEVGGDVNPVNRLTLLAPWIALAAVIIAGATMAVRRRRVQS